MVYLNDCVIPGCLAIIGEEVERWGQREKGGKKKRKRRKQDGKMEKEGASQGRKGRGRQGGRSETGVSQTQVVPELFLRHTCLLR